MRLKAHLFSRQLSGFPFVFVFVFFARREGALALSRADETRVPWSPQVCVSFQMRHRGKRRVAGYSGHEGSFDLVWRCFSGTPERGSASPGLPPGGCWRGPGLESRSGSRRQGPGPELGQTAAGSHRDGQNGAHSSKRWAPRGPGRSRRLLEMLL